MTVLLCFVAGTILLVVGAAGNLRSMSDTGNISLPSVASLAGAALFFAVATILI